MIGISVPSILDSAKARFRIKRQRPEEGKGMPDSAGPMGQPHTAAQPRLGRLPLVRHLGPRLGHMGALVAGLATATTIDFRRWW